MTRFLWAIRFGGDEAPAMIATFLAENDFQVRQSSPSAPAPAIDIDNSLHIFSELCPDAEIAEGLTANDLNDIEPWIQEIGNSVDIDNK